MRKALLLLPVALLACGEDWKGDGIVTGRSYDDDDSYDYFVAGTNQCTGTGTTRTCFTTPGYMAHHREPERWLLAVTDAEGESHTVSVPRDIYDSCRDTYHLDVSTMECEKAGGA
jgi:hypothetical protein